MARKVFFSFHYKPDNWRVSQVRNMGVIEGNAVASDNDWETVTKGGDTAIEKWIDGQLSGRTCTVLLIGAETAGRKWINKEIEKSWNKGLGIVGIHIHGLKDREGKTTTKGANPFVGFNVNGTCLSKIVTTFSPSGTESTDIYKSIETNLDSLIENAITIRGKYN